MASWPPFTSPHLPCATPAPHLPRLPISPGRKPLAPRMQPGVQGPSWSGLARLSQLLPNGAVTPARFLLHTCGPSVPHPAWLSPSALAGSRGHQEQSWAKAPHHEDHGRSVKLGCHAHFRATQPPGYPPSAGCALAQQVSAEPATSDNDRPSLGLSFPIHKMETTIVPSWEACWEVCVSGL